MGRDFDLARIGRGLPFSAAIPELRRQVAERRVAVVQAPPGTGKTTLVPPALSGLTGERVVVTQPRRMAARAAARRLASLSGVRLGGAVGFTVRGERRVSPATQIEFCTTGVLLRRLLADPALPGVGAVVLDEVHERQLDSDLLLGMLRELIELREDLTLVAMSATVAADRFAGILGTAENPAPVVSAGEVLHPVAVHWRPAPSGTRILDERGVTREFCGHVAGVIAEAYARHEGDVLAFVPGVWEVQQVCAGVADRLPGVPVLPLHGRLDARSQDAALARADARRVVVATAVAESSLTVPGVRIVVDSGLARRPRYDSTRDVSGLVTTSASRAAAIQRAGRAGRLGQGVVLRCLAEDGWARLDDADPPEIATADLTSATLDLACWGTPGGAGLALLDPPPAAALARAQEILRGLGALTAEGAVTAAGRRLARIPTDPRLARALHDGAPTLGARRSAEVVAMLAAGERAVGGDLTAQWRALRRGEAPGARSWRTETDRLASLIDPTNSHQGGDSGQQMSDDEAVGWVVALAHPGRLARARGGERAYLMAGGGGAELPPGSRLVGQPWLAVAELGRSETGAVIRSAVPIGEEQALAAAAGLDRTDEEVLWHGGRLTGRRVRRLGAIELSSTPIPPDPGLGAAAVAEAIRRQGLELLPWQESARSLRNRLAVLHHILGEPWPAVDDASLLARLDEWLAPELTAVAAGGRIGEVDTTTALRRLLDWESAAQLDELAPTTLRVPSGSAVPLRYPDHAQPDGSVVAAVKLQECFGLAETPRILGGRLPVLFHLLSPARRPLAITADLANFWNEVYPQVRAENRGRYSKHPWPEDPWTAPPRRGTNRSTR
ncbi:ATP-dependent helicase HrpB [Naumannella sp. ID2617S]|nr:ATP-dependent helicase HrpB [Naumannella sp. ID2617S]